MTCDNSKNCTIFSGLKGWKCEENSDKEKEVTTEHSEKWRNTSVQL